MDFVYTLNERQESYSDCYININPETLDQPYAAVGKGHSLCFIRTAYNLWTTQNVYLIYLYLYDM